MHKSLVYGFCFSHNISYHYNGIYQITTMKHEFYNLGLGKLSLLLACICFSLQAKAVFTPVTVTGFNQDVVANGIGAPTTSTTAAFDIATYCLVASDYKLNATSPSPTYFLPTSNVVNSAVTAGLSFNLAPYTGNNSLKLTTNGSSGTLTLTNTSLIGNVYLLCAGGDGSPTGNITVSFVGGGSQTFTGEVFSDWYNNSGFAIQGIGRVNRLTGAIDAASGTTNPRLYQKMLVISPSNYGKTIQSITITKTIATGSINVMAVTIDHQSCLPPMGVSAINVTTTTATVKWNSNSSASNGYQYAVNTSSTPPSSGTPTTDTFFNATGLNAGATYYLHVRSNCGGANSIWMTSNFTTLPCPSAGAPVVTNNVPGSVTFEWPGSTDAAVTGYQYHVTTSATTPSTGWSTTTATSATVSSLVPGQTYYAHVRTNCNNTNAPSQSVSFLNPFPPCDTIVTPNITDISMYGARITWNPSNNAIAYNIEVSTSDTPPANGSITTTDTTLVITNLTEVTQYYVHIRAHCGTTNYSNWTTTTFTTAATCALPSNIIVSNVTEHSAEIKWDEILGIDGYEFFLTLSPTIPTSSGSFIAFPILTPQNLYSNTTYYLHLRSLCSDTAISPWTTIQFTTDAGPLCEQPSISSVDNITSYSARLNWSPVSNVMQYEYAISTTLTPPSSGTTTTNTQATIYGLTGQTNYYFHVRSQCDVTKLSEWSSAPFTTLEDPTSIFEVNGGKNSIMTLTPNPAGDYFIVTIQDNTPLSTNAQLRVFDITGRVVRTVRITEHSTRISLSDLSPGLYQVHYEDAHTRQVSKLQKL